MPQQWKRLGSGSYNTAYKSDNSSEVLKIQHNTDDDLDTPIRSVRLWNELNPQLPPPAYISQTEHGTGWVCPFVEGRQASDKEMSEALIDIFNSSGRIVVDATAPRNFVTTKNGQVVCVDVGMALQMEDREEELFASRRSITSLKAWNVLQIAYTPFFDQSSKNYPETVSTVKALLFITSNRPDIFDVSFLKNNQQLVKKLSKAYDHADDKYIKLSLNDLAVEAPISFEHIRESCIKQLENYIKSRGSISTQGDFNPSLITKIFRDTVLTTHKVDEAKKLIDLIKSTSTLDEINSVIKNSTNNDLLKGTVTHGMERCIEKCALIIDKAEKYNPNLKLVSSGSSTRSD